MLIFLEVNIDGQRSLKCHVTNFFLTSCGLQYLQKKTTIIFLMRHVRNDSLWIKTKANVFLYFFNRSLSWHVFRFPHWKGPNSIFILFVNENVVGTLKWNHTRSFIWVLFKKNHTPRLYCRVLKFRFEVCMMINAQFWS